MSTETMPASEREPVSTGATAPEPTKSIEIKRSTDSKSGALRIKTEEISPAVKGPTKLYWIGTTEDSPYQNVTVGGVSFPRWTGMAVWGADGTPDRPEGLRAGARVNLTEGQVNAILRGVANRILRPVGGEERAKLIPKDARTYRPMKGDEPLGRYLYMHDLSKTGGHPPAEPTPLVE